MAGIGTRGAANSIDRDNARFSRRPPASPPRSHIAAACAAPECLHVTQRDERQGLHLTTDIRDNPSSRRLLSRLLHEFRGVDLCSSSVAFAC